MKNSIKVNTLILIAILTFASCGTDFYPHPAQILKNGASITVQISDDSYSALKSDTVFVEPRYVNGYLAFTLVSEKHQQHLGESTGYEAQLAVLKR